MQTVIKVIDYLTRAMAVIACVAVVCLMIHVSVEVTLRSLFNHTLSGTIIFVSNYYMILAVCLPLALVERMDAQISVDVLTQLIPPRPRYGLYAVTMVISAIVFGIVAWASWQEALTQFKLGKFMIENGIRFVTWYGYFAVPLGYGMAALWSLLKLARYLAGHGIGPVNGHNKEIEQVLYD